MCRLKRTGAWDDGVSALLTLDENLFVFGTVPGKSNGAKV